MPVTWQAVLYRRMSKEGRKSEAQALEARAAAEGQLAAAVSASEESAAKADKAQGDASRLVDELRDYKVGT